MDARWPGPGRESGAGEGGGSARIGTPGPGRTILYLHGGGFCFHLPKAYATLGRRLAALTGARVLLPDYRLAPEHPYPAAVDDCLAAYRWLVEEEGGDARSVAVAGSAGAYLVLATLVRAREAGLPPPACAVRTEMLLDQPVRAAKRARAAGVMDRRAPWRESG